MTKRPLKYLIKIGQEKELSAQDFEQFSNTVLLTAFCRKNTMKVLSINKARISLELQNRGIHPQQIKLTNQ